MLLIEKMGDKPAWMKIKAYRESGRRSELILSLGRKKKDYWFPLSPKVYSAFQTKIQESRLDGLKYLQSYIRRYRGYAGRWPSKRYVKANKLAERSFMETITSSMFNLLEAGKTVQEVSIATRVDPKLVVKFAKASGIFQPESDLSVN